VRKKERKKTVAFGLWMWRRILRVPWTEENKPLSIGRSETRKITGSNNCLTKVALFWLLHESKRVTGTGHCAWTGCRIQEAGKTTDVLAWQYQGSYQTTIGSFKRNSTGQEKMAHAGGRKDPE